METRNFKDGVKLAADYLLEHGVDVPHTRLLEALSRAFGHRNWSTLRANLGAVEATAEPSEAPCEWTPGEEPMSSAVFVQHGGNRCPHCGSSELEADGIEADGPDCWDETTCGDCGATWQTTYRVGGYAQLSVPEEPTPGLDASTIRAEVVDDLVEDVKERMRKYSFRPSSLNAFEEAVRESALVLALDITDAEALKAAQTLY